MERETLVTNKPLTTLGVAAAAAVFMAGSQAYAGICPTDAPVMTVLASGFSCTVGDKTFSAFDITGEGSGAKIQFGEDGPLFAVTLSRDGEFIPADTLTFDYTVTASDGMVIRVGTVGVDVSFPSVSTISMMNGSRLTPATVFNGGTAMITFTPAVTSVVVRNSSSIFPGAELNSITNDFTQEMVSTSVPEPASLSLFGLGLAGLFATRRRKH